MLTKFRESRFTAHHVLLLAAIVFLLAGAAQAAEKVTLQTNPYAGVDWDHVEQSKANLHTHTKKSDGAMEPGRVIREYHSRGYRILAITDHNRCTWPWAEFDRDAAELGMVAIPGNELSRHHHTLSLFCDFATKSRAHNKALKEVGEADGVAVLCHPAMHWWRRHKQAAESGVPDEVVKDYAKLFETYPHLLGIEVFNGTRPDREHPLDRELWDKLLVKLMPERPVWGFSNDDMHGMKHMGRDWIWVLSPKLEQQAVRDAISRGAFLIASTRFHGGEKGSVEATPKIQRIDHDDKAGTITIVATEDGKPLAQDKCRWIADGELVHTGPTLNYRTTPGIDSYVRAELIGQGGTLFTNPFALKR